MILKICRVKYNNKKYFGVIDEEDVYIFDSFEKIERNEYLECKKAVKFKMLAPVEPSKIVCIGLNYVDHAKELRMRIPEEPIIFLKPPSSVIGDREYIVLPNSSSRVDYEAELAVVIGKRGKNIPEKDAYEYILGYTCFNDVTARDLQKKDGQWTRAKSFDTFAPIGPWIVTKDEIKDPHKLDIKLILNNEIKQNSNTKNLIFSIPKLISFISEIMTLEPFDVIATGTPPGVGPLKRGDVVKVWIEKIGTLTNYVK